MEWCLQAAADATAALAQAAEWAEAGWWDYDREPRLTAAERKAARMAAGRRRATTGAACSADPNGSEATRQKRNFDDIDYDPWAYRQYRKWRGPACTWEMAARGHQSWTSSSSSMSDSDADSSPNDDCCQLNVKMGSCKVS